MISRHSLAACIAAATLATSSLAASSLHAQSLAEQTASQGVGPSRFISVNPFLPLFGYFSGEYEQRIKDNVALALSASHVKLDDRYTNVDVKLRLYPNEQALEGFSIAASLGVASVKRDDDDFFECAFGADCTGQQYKAFSTPSFAMEMGYQWLLGRRRGTAITAGFGAKRYLGGSKDQFSGINRVVPTVRLSVGYGF